MFTIHEASKVDKKNKIQKFVQDARLSKKASLVFGLTELS